MYGVKILNGNVKKEKIKAEKYVELKHFFFFI